MGPRKMVASANPRLPDRPTRHEAQALQMRPVRSRSTVPANRRRSVAVAAAGVRRVRRAHRPAGDGRSPLTALLTAGAYLVINQVEGNILTPRIQGEAVKVHQVLVFLAVFTGGEIGGLLGAAMAVPLLAVLRVLVGFFADRLRVQSPRHGMAIAASPVASPSGDAGSPAVRSGASGDSGSSAS